MNSGVHFGGTPQTDPVEAEHVPMYLLPLLLLKGSEESTVLLPKALVQKAIDAQTKSWSRGAGCTGPSGSEHTRRGAALSLAHASFKTSLSSQAASPFRKCVKPFGLVWCALRASLREMLAGSNP